MTFETKPIPLITWRNMAPPFEDHPYFAQGADLPFETRAEGFSLVNAWWLAEAALLSYAEPGFARSRFKGAGFDDVWFFSGPSTQCYVAAAGRQSAVVAFRGTECRLDQGPEALAQFMADLSVDLDIRWVPVEGGGRIHRGFRDGLDEVWPDLHACLEALAARGCAIWITGHSLGGALALLAAARVEGIQGLYTYGAPRVGDHEFAAAFPVRSFRMVHNNDVVPHLPPFPYTDIGELRYIDSAGVLHPQIGRPLRWMDEIQGHIQCLIENARHLDEGPAATLPGGLKDHTPLLYALHLWNNLVQSRPA